MKIYFNLVEDELKEVWPKTMYELTNLLNAELPKALPPGMEHYSGFLSGLLMEGVYQQASKLSMKLGLFEYDASDVVGGVLDTTLSRFALELQVDEAVDYIRSGYENIARREEVVKSLPEGEPLRAAVAGFDWDAFNPIFIDAVRDAFKSIEEKIWITIPQQLHKLVFRF